MKICKSNLFKESFSIKESSCTIICDKKIISGADTLNERDKYSSKNNSMQCQEQGLVIFLDF